MDVTTTTVSMYVGLLKFTALEKSDSGDDSSCFVSELIFAVSHLSSTSKTKSVVLRARNDVKGMLRLAVSLYDEITKFDASMTRVAIPKLEEQHRACRVRQGA